MKKSNSILLVLFILFLSSFTPAYSQEFSQKMFRYYTDKRDGTVYRVIKIGDLWWMAENMNYKTTSGSYCYNDESVNCETYGRLYEFEAAKEACPEGWQIPSKEDWMRMLHSFDSFNFQTLPFSGAAKKLNLKGDIGFNYLYGGDRSAKGKYESGTPDSRSSGNATFWTSTENKKKTSAWHVTFYSYDYHVSIIDPALGWGGYSFSLRCMTDNESILDK